MLNPNIAYILFFEQWYTVYGLVYNLNFVQFADISALNDACSKEFNNWGFWKVLKISLVKKEDWKKLKILNVKTENLKIA